VLLLYYQGQTCLFLSDKQDVLISSFSPKFKEKKQRNKTETVLSSKYCKITGGSSRLQGFKRLHQTSIDVKNYDYNTSQDFVRFHKTSREFETEISAVSPSLGSGLWMHQKTIFECYTVLMYVVTFAKKISI
jgi:hypothetical protein